MGLSITNSYAHYGKDENFMHNFCFKPSENLVFYVAKTQKPDFQKKIEPCAERRKNRYPNSHFYRALEA